MNGREKCELLKDIRRKIAEVNDIVYLTSECKNEGDCAGTCPKCDAEIRYLDREMTEKARRGEDVKVAGIMTDFVALDNDDSTSSEAEQEFILGNICIDEDKKWDLALDELELSTRTYNSLKRAGICTVDELANMSYEELAKTRYLRKKSLDELIGKLTKLGITIWKESEFNDEDRYFDDIDTSLIPDLEDNDY